LRGPDLQHAACPHDGDKITKSQCFGPIVRHYNGR
jgi:hypothetical protein